MSQVFHKSCYTTRSSGYKYRTLSTNTGERKRRDSKEDCSVDKVFRDIRRAISTKIDTELEKTGHSRELIFEKFEKIDSKINTMLDLQDNILAMRQTLTLAENSLIDMIQKVQKIEAYTSEPESLKSKKSSFRSPPPPAPLPEDELGERERELYSSEISPVWENNKAT
ncbi:hypothetical protein MSG28_005087 [Choristoneura fumiferana]|uniref:Uncharacterized protein n=1 Tax=Choristoneura fumiferana TaxID=7141 RepID=A0ACC0JPX9_CHOFU|nr:hypothetical protein MSG28_005087 [Choristoneura fumiferana]